MYLSRLILNPRSRVVRRDLADVQHLHRTVLAGFGQKPSDVDGARAHYGVLYRLEITPQSGRLVLYVQSQEEPDWTQLDPDYLLRLPGLENPACKSVAGAYEAIQPGMTLAFRLRANPTRRVKPAGSTPERRTDRGKRVELRREDDQVAWLKRKADEGGFALLHTSVAADLPDLRTVPMKVEGSHPKGKLTFGAVLFEGRLRVTDPARFSETLQRGIGPAKAYGFGLLSIARG